MKLIISIVLVLVLSCNAYAEMTKSDVALMSTYSVLHIIDWGQTRYISHNGDRYYEMNPILGKHPSTDKVDAYMISTFLGMWALAYVIPEPYKKFFIGSGIVLEGGLAIHNNNIGIKIDF